jgi:16S rRNA (cytidine1402-2'-O)-methyltransferase
VMSDGRTTVVLEAPGRLAGTLGELAAHDPGRPAAVVRELTKLHEEVWRGPLGEAAAAFAARGQVRGEVVVVVGGAPEPPTTGDAEVEAAVRAALGRDPSAGPRQVADRVAASLGVPRRRAYEMALRVRPQAGRDTGRSGDG